MSLITTPSTVWTSPRVHVTPKLLPLTCLPKSRSDSLTTKTGSQFIKLARSVFAARSVFSDNHHVILKRLSEIHGPRFRFGFGKQVFAVISDGKAMRDVCSLDHSIMSAGEGRRSFLDVFPKQSLLYICDDRRDIVRRSVSRAWRSTIQELNFENDLGILVAKLEGQSTSQQFKSLATFIASVSSKLVLGDSTLIQPALTNQLFHSFGALHPVGMLLPFTRKIPKFGRGIGQLREQIQQLSDTIETVLTERRYAENSLLGNLASHAKLSFEEIRDNASFFFATMIRTLLTLLENVVNNLGTSPKWQHSIRAELECGSTSPTLLRAAIKETLRMHPVVPIIPRRVMSDCSVDGFLLSKGDAVLMSPWISHYDESVFPEPELFKPERFAFGQSYDNWLPFGGGRNHCISGHWSTNFMTKVLQEIVPQFELGTSEPLATANSFSFKGPIAVRRRRTCTFKLIK